MNVNQAALIVIVQTDDGCRIRFMACSNEWRAKVWTRYGYLV